MEILKKQIGTLLLAGHQQESRKPLLRLEEMMTLEENEILKQINLSSGRI